MKNSGGITIDVISFNNNIIIPTFGFYDRAKEKGYVFCNSLGEPIYKSTTGVKNEPEKVVDNKA